jgi:hypothetical protein
MSRPGLPQPTLGQAPVVPATGFAVHAPLP